MFIHLIAIDKKHNAGFHGTRVLSPTDAILHMFLASRPINLPCFLRVDMPHENATDLYDELHKQGRFIWDGGDFERDIDVVAQPILVVDYDAMYRTHIVPWAYKGMELGHRTFEKTDLETSWVDETFSPNVRFAELLKWVEGMLKMQSAKSKDV